jgi:hypothetical protein
MTTDKDSEKSDWWSDCCRRELRIKEWQCGKRSETTTKHDAMKEDGREKEHHCDRGKVASAASGSCRRGRGLSRVWGDFAGCVLHWVHASHDQTGGVSRAQMASRDRQGQSPRSDPAQHLARAHAL